MIKSAVFIAAAVLTMTSCGSNHSPAMDITLLIYPSSGGGDEGYKITVRSDTLHVTSNKVDMRDGRLVLTEVSHILSREESDTLAQYTSVLTAKQAETVYDQFCFDSWRFDISICGRLYGSLDKTSVLGESEDEKVAEMIKWITFPLRLCPLELDLRGFA